MDGHNICSFKGYEPFLLIAVHGTKDVSQDLLMSIDRVKFTAKSAHESKIAAQKTVKASYIRFLETYMEDL